MTKAHGIRRILIVGFRKSQSLRREEIKAIANPRESKPVKQKIEKLAKLAGLSSIEVVRVELESVSPYVSNSKNAPSIWVPDKELQVGGFRLFSRDSLVEENTNLMPGCLVFPLSFISIAATESGDVFALDCETGNVLSLSHEKYNPDSISPGWNETFTDFLPDIPINRENVIRTAERSFVNLDSFYDSLILSCR